MSPRLEAGQYRAVIPPVREGSRPFWSVMIPTYNCAKYLRETLSSVLIQDPGRTAMQIEVVDDHSTLDDPEKVVEELGRGRVDFYRQPENTGHTGNFETCLKRSRGIVVHLLHGDDCVLDGFYGRLQPAFEENREIGAAFCRHIYMDQDGHWLGFSGLEQQRSGLLANWLERIAITQRIQTPSMVVRREVYERLGGFDRRLSWAEDWEMWVRIAALFPVWYEVQALAAYRMHSGSNTTKYATTGENLRDIRRVIDIIKDYLPEARVGELSKRSREHWAHYALSLADEMTRTGEVGGAINQIREAFRCRKSFDIILSALPFLPDLAKLWARRATAVNGGGS